MANKVFDKMVIIMYDIFFTCANLYYSQCKKCTKVIWFQNQINVENDPRDTFYTKVWLSYFVYIKCISINLYLFICLLRRIKLFANIYYQYLTQAI